MTGEKREKVEERGIKGEGLCKCNKPTKINTSVSLLLHLKYPFIVRN